MFEPKFTITNEITSALTEIERARGFLEAATLSNEWISKMQSTALVLEAYHTTHIEGTQLTLDQSKQIWAGKKVAAADPEDVQELLNYRNAFELVAQYIGLDDPITESLTREIHKLLVRNVRGNSAAPGQYRKVQNYVVNSKTQEVIYTPPPAHDVPILMQELINWLNLEKKINPILAAGIAQFQLVHIHPFLDGNGRTARLLSTLNLYRNGYDFKKLFTISEYYDRNRNDYYAAIQSVRKNNMDMTIWLDYFSRGLSTQLHEIKKLGALAIKESLKPREQQLSDRQKIILDYLNEHHSIRIQELEQLFKHVTRRTLQRELKHLIEKKLIVSSGATSNIEYRLSQND